MKFGGFDIEGDYFVGFMGVDEFSFFFYVIGLFGVINVGIFYSFGDNKVNELEIKVFEGIVKFVGFII